MDFLSQVLARRAGGKIRSARPLKRRALVSVVIPCYNYGCYLRQCVESVTHGQPLIDVEVIIVDDRSTDDSLEIARAIEQADKRIRVIAHETNKGHIATFNDGLAEATGEFVLLLSADDMVTPGALTRAVALFVAEPSVGLVYGNAIHFHDNPPSCRIEGKDWIVWRGVDWLRNRCRVGYNVAASPEVVMRMSVLRAIGDYRADIPHAGDFEMWLRTAAAADVGYLAKVDQAYYRHHAVNMNKVDFHSGTARGQLIDLKQRWRSFEVVFAGIGSRLQDSQRLLRMARQTMARQALEHVNYAYARGFRDFPLAEFEALADEILDDAHRTSAGRALARRKKLGMISLPLHPLWATSAIWRRFRGLLQHWRHRRIGV